ncbi:hypothetical protein GCM10023231_41190 [Olivibacter ginsenosidimutans]|uniref:N-acetyltransferase domain-containing protein n=1 Tax=Olivibacter ginsenosidimutans TaxID=1176537 RepID=A0ABP9CH52_9SPHI
MSAITIRTKLQPGDLSYIAYIHSTLYADECHYGLGFEAYVLRGLSTFAEDYDADKDCVWMVEQEGKMVGCLIAVMQRDALQLRYYLLLPDYRGQGIGKLLMEHFIAHMRDKGFGKAFLWTTNEQQGAISLYTKFGFLLTEKKPSTAFGKPLMELRYDLVLAQQGKVMQI